MSIYSTSENVPSDMCAQRRIISACAFAESDMNVRWAHFKKPNDKRILHAGSGLIRLRECTGCSESSLS